MKNESNKRNRRILVIDDNASIHADFRKILARNDVEGDDLVKADTELFGQPVVAPQEGPDLELVSVFQGQDGLAAVREAVQSGRPFAMAFVDVRMPPGWDGIETTARLWDEDEASRRANWSLGGAGRERGRCGSGRERQAARLW